MEFSTCGTNIVPLILMTPAKGLGTLSMAGFARGTLDNFEVFAQGTPGDGRALLFATDGRGR